MFSIPTEGRVEQKPDAAPPKKRRRFWLKFILATLGFALICAAGLALWVYQLVKDLPDEAAIKSYRPRVATEVRDASGELIFYLSDKKVRYWVPLQDISENLVKAVIISEDDTFFRHSGLNVKEIKEAFLRDIKKRRFVRGASTITQQLAKNAFLSKEKTIARKVKEIYLAKRIEKVMPKRRILELYMNEAEWGKDIYGAEAAARYYFGKSSRELNLVEASMLAGILPNPKYFDPRLRLPKVKKKQARVLGLMRGARLVTPEQAQETLDMPLHLVDLSSLNQSGMDKLITGSPSPQRCRRDLLVGWLEKRFGKKRLYTGLTIRLTIDLGLQRNIDTALTGAAFAGTTLANADTASVASDSGELDAVLVVKEQGRIRAFACLSSGRADLIKENLPLILPLSPGFEYIVTNRRDFLGESLVQE